MRRAISHTLWVGLCVLSALAAVTGCAPPLSSGAYQCDPNDAASCPGDWLCQCRSAGCDWRCYQEAGAYCGDGELSAAEECDPAAPPELLTQVQSCGDGGLPYCLLDCTVRCTACGNGILEHTSQGREECDDGNRLAGDGCSPACKLARCGDGAVDPGVFEACDDGAGNSWAPAARCRPDCQPGRCGDGVADPGEVCDDGNDDPADHCSNDCQTELRCGNGIVDEVVGEECEDGNSLSHDGCSSDCRFERILPLPARQRAAYPAAPGPHPERRNAAMIYDPARDRLVLFGGSYTTTAGETALLGDTWERHGQSWVAVGSAGPLPAERAPLAFDGVRQRVVLAALDARGVLLWEWDGRTWQRVEAHPQSLRPAQLGRITFDMRRRTLLLWSGEGTWEWNGQTRRWTRWQTQQAPAGPVTDQELVYDPVADRSLLLGNDVWEWDGERRRWRLLTTPDGAPSTPARYAYDFDRQEAVRIDPDSNTWSWSREHEAWRLEVPAEALGDYAGAALAYQSGTGILLIGPSPGSDTQRWLGGGWLALSPAIVQLPGSSYVTGHDPLRNTYWALGVGSETNNWVWAEGAWIHVSNSISSPPAGGFVVFDVSRNVTVYMTYDQTQEFHWSALGWVDPVITEPRVYLGAGYDYSGRTVSTVYRSAAPQYIVIRGDWDGQSWSELWFSQHRLEGAAVYDRARQLVIFLSTIWAGESRRETFELSRTFSRLRQDIRLSTPEAHLFYDLHSKRVLRCSSTSCLTWTGATWLPFDPNGGGASPTPIVVPRDVVSTSDTRWHLLNNLTSREESCASGFDLDGDGRIGCEDEDCWHLCTPTCSPGQPCPADEPRCGDGTCNTFLETPRLCPADCGAPVPSCGDFHCDPEETPQTCPGDCS